MCHHPWGIWVSERAAVAGGERGHKGAHTPMAAQAAASTMRGAAKFPQLLAPLQVGRAAGQEVWLRNRALMGSMHTGLEDGGSGFLSSSRGLDEMAAFFEERARGNVGLIVTGGIAPNAAGKGSPTAAVMTDESHARAHRVVTDAVHAVQPEDGGLQTKIAMQILHTGRYAYHFNPVSASPLKAPIGWFKPKELSGSEVRETIRDYVRCAELAREAGYDGVEIMGSEGYLINQFIVNETNHRTDEWGGSYENRIRLALEIVRQTRKAVGDDFILIYRLSMLDLVKGGSDWPEIVHLAQAIEDAGASIINTGIGWHEARVPTIATMVPRAGFTWVTKKLRGEVNIPLCTTNRVNMPGVAESVLASGAADMVSMARPFLADADLVRKAEEDRVDEINTCIGCNQACLDHIFENRRASCLVNPRAAFETQLVIQPVDPAQKKRVAIVGAGPAGLACATTAAERGHDVTLFDRENQIGGQFIMARRIPGKEEFFETTRYFSTMLNKHGVNMRLGTEATLDILTGQASDEEGGGFDAVVLATGVVPRELSIPGTNHEKFVSYIDVLRHGAKVGRRVAIIGAGGIGFDVAEFLVHGCADGSAPERDANGSPLGDTMDEDAVREFAASWGIDLDNETRGGLAPPQDTSTLHGSPVDKIYMLQRSKGKLGARLGKTTGWIHRTALRKSGVVELMDGVEYLGVDDDGLHINLKGGNSTVLDVDTVISCAGQESLRELEEPLKQAGMTVFRIGGAELAAELDAKRAIDQGTRLATQIESAQSGEVFNAPINFGAKAMTWAKKVLGKD